MSGRRTRVPGVSSAELPYVDEVSDTAESLVLDIGDDIGALVLYADEEWLGREIDITPVGLSRSHHTHTMIRRRHAVDRAFVAGVYPDLPRRDLHRLGNGRRRAGRGRYRRRAGHRAPGRRLPTAGRTDLAGIGPGASMQDPRVPR